MTRNNYAIEKLVVPIGILLLLTMGCFGAPQQASCASKSCPQGEALALSSIPSLSDFQANSQIISGNYSEIGQWDGNFGEALAVTVEGDYAYLACDWDGLLILDVSDTSSPSLVGTFYKNDLEVLGVTVDGSYAYLGCRPDILVIIDISDPSDPVEVGSLDYDGWGQEIVVEDAHAGHHVHLVTGYNRRGINTGSSVGGEEDLVGGRGGGDVKIHHLGRVAVHGGPGHTAGDEHQVKIFAGAGLVPIGCEGCGDGVGSSPTDAPQGGVGIPQGGVAPLNGITGLGV